MLKAKVAIGGIRCRETYAPEDKAFHRSAIPESAAKARQQVKASVKKDILGVTKPAWNGDMSLGKPICTRDSNQLKKYERFEYAFNYRAETLPEPAALEPTSPFGRSFKTTLKTTKRMEEMPVHPALKEKSRWSTGTALTERERARMAEEERQSHLRHSRAVGKSIIGYKNPIKQEAEWVEKLRAEREASAHGDAPPSPIRAPRSVAPRLKLTSTVTRRFKTYTHTGTYSTSKFEKGRVWSCCLASDPQAQGCVVHTTNPDAYNFVGFT